MNGIPESSNADKPQMPNGKSAIYYHVSALHVKGAPPEGNKKSVSSDSKMLPLANWDLLYYTANAEIRMMYCTLREHHRKLGNVIIHNSGSNGAGDEPRRAVSVLRLAATLEQLWSTLTEPRIVAALDRAVRTRIYKTWRKRREAGLARTSRRAMRAMTIPASSFLAPSRKIRYRCRLQIVTSATTDP